MKKTTNRPDRYLTAGYKLNPKKTTKQILKHFESISEFSRHMGVARMTVSRHIKGERKNRQFQICMAEALKCKVADLT